MTERDQPPATPGYGGQAAQPGRPLPQAADLSQSSSPPQLSAVDAKLRRELGITDSVLLIAGGIIGSGIFLTTGAMAAAVPSPLLILGVWVAAAVLSFLGALAFAELGAMLPGAGGPYIFLREAYGEGAGFLFAWMMLVVGETGTIAALGVGFAEYLGVLVPAVSTARAALSVHFSGHLLSISRGQLVAVCCISGLSLLNFRGVRWGAWIQNLSTFAKLAAIAVFVVLGALVGKGSLQNFKSAGLAGNSFTLGSQLLVALIGALWAFDGWSYISFVASEVKNPGRTIPRALMIAVAIVAAAYLGCNVMYFYALPVGRAAGVMQIAHASAAALFGPRAARAISTLIMLSCFGAMNAAILCGARLYSPMAADGLFFRAIADVHPRYHTPGKSLLLQAVWACALALSGRYDQLFTYVMFMMTISYIASVLGMFVLRRKQPERTRPYRCAGYPYLPGIYVIVMSVFAVNTIAQRPLESIAGLALVAAGLPIFLIYRLRRQHQPAHS